MNKLHKAIEGLRFDEEGLIPAIVVDAENKQVLMMAWMNAGALARTVETGRTHFWSRSRQKLWMKGETSGHVQDVQAILADCDKDTLVIEVIQHTAACHEGYRSCFYRRLGADGQWQVVAEKVFEPRDVYRGFK